MICTHIHILLRHLFDGCWVGLGLYYVPISTARYRRHGVSRADGALAIKKLK